MLSKQSASINMLLVGFRCPWLVSERRINRSSLVRHPRTDPAVKQRWKNPKSFADLGKTLFPWRPLHLGIAQIAIGPPPALNRALWGTFFRAIFYHSAGLYASENGNIRCRGEILNHTFSFIWFCSTIHSAQTSKENMISAHPSITSSSQRQGHH